jgi:hypothetical protein
LKIPGSAPVRVSTPHASNTLCWINVFKIDIVSKSTTSCACWTYMIWFSLTHSFKRSKTAHDTNSLYHLFYTQYSTKYGFITGRGIKKKNTTCRVGFGCLFVCLFVFFFWVFFFVFFF